MRGMFGIMKGMYDGDTACMQTPLALFASSVPPFTTICGVLPRYFAGRTRLAHLSAARNLRMLYLTCSRVPGKDLVLD